MFFLLVLSSLLESLIVRARNLPARVHQPAPKLELGKFIDREELKDLRQHMEHQTSLSQIASPRELNWFAVQGGSGVGKTTAAEQLILETIDYTRRRANKDTLFVHEKMVENPNAHSYTGIGYLTYLLALRHLEGDWEMLRTYEKTGNPFLSIYLSIYLSITCPIN